MTLGEKLQELRRTGAMSQDVLAERLGVSRQAVSKWERDEAVPETDKIVKIARIFGVSTDYLLLDEEPNRQEPPREQPPVYRQAPPKNPAGGDFSGRAEQFIRRHGYKAGYVLIAIGAAICLFSLGLRLLWPVFAEGFFGGFMDTVDFYQSGNVILDEDGNPIGSFEEVFGDGVVYDENGNLVDSWNELFSERFAGGVFDPFGQSAWQGMRNAIQMQANLFLLLMLPGWFMIAAGIFVVIKGKQLNVSE